MIIATVLTERYWTYCAFKENIAGSFHILNKEFGIFSTRGTYGKYPQESETYGDATFSLSAHTHTFSPSSIFLGQGSFMRTPYAYSLVPWYATQITPCDLTSLMVSVLHTLTQYTPGQHSQCQRVHMPLHPYLNASTAILARKMLLHSQAKKAKKTKPHFILIHTHIFR